MNRFCFVAASCLIFVSAALAEPPSATQHMVLENDSVRLVVLPEVGGAVVELTDKTNGVNFVAGGERVKPGSPGWGWKDLTSAGQNERAFMGLPYKAAYFDEAQSRGIRVTCEAYGLRIVREMRIGTTGKQVEVAVTLTNVSDKAQRLQIRFHPYCQVDDPYAESSVIVTPLADGEIGTIPVGAGQDQQFLTHDGYWLAGNYNKGVGLWMTFRKEQSQCHMTWTDYNFKRHPMRGAFIVEPCPVPVMRNPGESIEYRCSFFPYSPNDDPSTIPLGVLDDESERKRARRFLTLVKENLKPVGTSTMAPPRGHSGAVVAEQNRFGFVTTRRDRMALRDWGLLDAMLEGTGLQDLPVRCRLTASLFPGVNQTVKLTYRIQASDAYGKIVRQKERAFTLDPQKQRDIDVREELPMKGLEDGAYTLRVEGVIEGESEPAHIYEERVRLVGNSRKADEADRKATATLSERSFVTALREVAIPTQRVGNVTVPVGVENVGPSRVNWPVRLGVPFAVSIADAKSVLTLRDPQGRQVPVQTEVMSTWADGSLRWVLINFSADLPANGHVFYTLHATKESDSTPIVVSAKLLKESDTEFSVETGKLRLSWKKDTDKDVSIDASLILELIKPSDIWWDDADGQRYVFSIRGPDSGWTIEENGPIHAVVRANGWYFNAAGKAIAMGELRAEFHVGRSQVRLLHTVTYTGDPWRDRLASYGMALSLGTGRFSGVHAHVDGRGRTGKDVTIYQRSSDFCDVTSDGVSEQRLGRSDGSMEFVGPESSVRVAQGNFWQMAPKSMDAQSQSGRLVCSFWPREAGALDFKPREDGWMCSSVLAVAMAVGMSRTHDIVVDFDPNINSNQLTPEVEDFDNQPVVALTPPRYLQQTGVLLHLSPCDPAVNPEVERYISEMLDFYIRQQRLFGWYGQWHFGALPNMWNPLLYRWIDYGRHAWILNELNIVDLPWLAFARSGDRKYLTLAQSNTRHLMEVATIRWNPAFPEDQGLSRRHHETVWQGNGDRGHSMLDPFMEQWFLTGYRPAWDAARRMAGAMAQTQSGTWRYLSNPIAGVSRMYLETHEPYWKEQADRMWNTLCYPEKNTWWEGPHGARMVMWYSQINPQCAQVWRDWSVNAQKPGRFNEPDALAAQYRMTGDKKYLDALSKLPLVRIDDSITQYVLNSARAWCFASVPWDAKARGTAVPEVPKAPD